ncbi:MAG: amidohydrolase [Candidatus Limnocylindrales bacterium]
MKVDRIVEGAIATLSGGGNEPGFGFVEAVAIADGRVVAAGPAAGIRALAGRATRRTILEPDEAAVPGLTDAHLHLADTALAAVRLDLTPAATLEAGLASIGAAHRVLADPNAWLRGGGWDIRRWGRWPTAADLAPVAPGRAVLLWSHDLHAIWASARALEIAGLDRTTAEPPGGLIRRLEDGSPAGVLHEAATGLVTRSAPDPRPEELERLIERTAHDLLGLGIVALHDPGELEMDSTLSRGFAAIERLATADRLPIRVHAGFREGALELAIDRGLRSGSPLGRGEGRARVGWLKLFADGTLGSRTAAVVEPYLAEPRRGEAPGGPIGLLATPQEVLAQLAGRAARAGIATQIHAIGDRAVRAALAALEPTAGSVPLRPRIEHVQLVDPDDLARFGRAAIVASVQPGDLRDDADRARRAWGRRRSIVCPWGSLGAAGTTLAFGSDAPTADPSPWPALAMAVTRRDPGWSARMPTFGPGERLSIVAALRAACRGGAIAAGESDHGHLGMGSGADLIVIPRRALSDPEALREVRPRLVLVDGAVAFEA